MTVTVNTPPELYVMLFTIIVLLSVMNIWLSMILGHLRNMP